MAFLGPDTAPMGERSMTAPVTESQIAATIAAALGEDYNAEVAKAGRPIEDVINPTLGLGRTSLPEAKQLESAAN